MFKKIIHNQSRNFTLTTVPIGFIFSKSVDGKDLGFHGHHFDGPHVISRGVMNRPFAAVGHAINFLQTRKQFLAAA